MTRYHLNRFAEGQRPSRGSSTRPHRCRGCGVLLLASQHCEPCETATVHVITDLGPTDGPGRIVHARLLGLGARRRPSGWDDPYSFTRASRP